MADELGPSGGERPGAPCVGGDGWIEPGDDDAVRSMATDDGLVFWHNRPECEEAAAEELGYTIDAEGNWQAPPPTEAQLARLEEWGGPAPALEELGGDG